MSSLAGKWKFVKEGSDHLPGVDKLPYSPLISRVMGNSDAEFFTIERTKTYDVEEIILSYTMNGTSHKSYQVGTLNYENTKANAVMLGVVQNCDEEFAHFTIAHFGPECGQSSREVYKLDSNRRHIKVTISFVASEGSTMNQTKYLVRADSSTEPELIDITHFRNAEPTAGWAIFEFWPSTVLTSCDVSIVRAVKVKTLSPNYNQNSRVVEVIWPSSNWDSLPIDFSRIARKLGNRLVVGEEVTMFILKVTVGQSTWYVAHRYTEFDLLRHFLLSQNPYNTMFKDCNAKFPPKQVFLPFRPMAFEQRIQGLEYFMLFYLENARYCRQNSIDSMLSFLEIPEHMQTVSKIIKGNEVANPTMNNTAANSRPSVSSQAAAAAPVSNERPSFQPAPTRASTVSAIGTPSDARWSTLGIAEQRQSAAEPFNLAAHAAFEYKKHDREALHTVLEDGMLVIKHGRSGAPKKRLLYCDPEVTKLLWRTPLYGAHKLHDQENDKDKDKETGLNDSRSNNGSAGGGMGVSHIDRFIEINKIKSVVTGSELDPFVLQHIPSSDADGKSVNSDITSTTTKEKRKSRFSLRIGKKGSGDLLYGTAILRRNVRKEDMHLCLSLILPDRSLDIQCLNQQDFDILHTYFIEIARQNNASSETKEGSS